MVIVQIAAPISPWGLLERPGGYLGDRKYSPPRHHPETPVSAVTTAPIAKSAFDVVVPKLLLRNMFLAGMDGNTINYLNNRFLNRQTYLDWNKNIMGSVGSGTGWN